MHGEFKVPGGKLVVVDLDVVDGTIANFRLAGDFFLEPDEALDAINAAVERARRPSPMPRRSPPPCRPRCPRARSCSASRPSRSRPRSAARCSRRPAADYEWQLVHPGRSGPLMHLALDEVLAEEVGEGRRKPTLRIWEWD